MINIRSNVFETNSSSSHSISLNFSDEKLENPDDTLVLNKWGELTIEGENFTGLEFLIAGAKSKAALIATYVFVHGDMKLKERFESVLKERTGCTSVHYDIRFCEEIDGPANTFYFPDIEGLYWYDKEGDEFGFVDILKNKKRLKTFIFDSDVTIEAGEIQC